MDKEQAIKIVRQYKEAISGLFANSKVYLYGSCAKGTARTDSDIDVAVVVPVLGDDWLLESGKLWRATLGVSTRIEPVLLEESDTSPLYHDIITTGLAV